MKERNNYLNFGNKINSDFRVDFLWISLEKVYPIVPGFKIVNDILFNSN